MGIFKNISLKNKWHIKAQRKDHINSLLIPAPSTKGQPQWQKYPKKINIQTTIRPKYKNLSMSNTCPFVIFPLAQSTDPYDNTP